VEDTEAVFCSVNCRMEFSSTCLRTMKVESMALDVANANRFDGGIVTDVNSGSNKECDSSPLADTLRIKREDYGQKMIQHHQKVAI
jgi:hypothetical protein